MRLNSDTVLSSPPHPVVLVPYTKAHVPTYHAWMQSPTLLHLTASTRLTLAEEHANMHSWRADERKLTFIILDLVQGSNHMVGDVNLHLLNAESEELGDADTVAGELEVMVAEEGSRNRGTATVALRLMMAYAREHVKVDVFVAKVMEENEASLRLFRDKLGFVPYRTVKAFGEIHLKKEVRKSFDEQLKVVMAHVSEQSFAESVYSSMPVGNVKNDGAAEKGTDVGSTES
ncbi:unnamed protein product [Chondrus crispus]|uniref:N-acetyltransferase domain-containing protein n=1 Tax=Chondrus crispus TaxID=2769 RepID=R7Q0S0_CHOCR|nr:unnamed protein product [Chondrus crispus]CDF32247.1 unnamed protein product [Chondrus crispus]|eukprot:XP_005711912.1 unnamed protein product [Chondrus crispus]